MTATKSNIEIITGFVAAQMDAGQVPPNGSKELKGLELAVGEVLRTKADLDLFGHKVLALVIAKVGSNIAAQSTLEKFIRGGDFA